MVPTFGRDTIRKFCANVSDLTKLAARDFEDLLQVSAQSIASKYCNLDMPFSALYPSLNTYFRNLITRLF
jgi:acyl carrier protein phosphodiesterase